MQAGWIALLLSAQTGEPVTAAQLLGEEAEEAEAKMADAQEKLKALRSKMKKAGL